MKLRIHPIFLPIVALGAIIGVLQHFAFGTPFTVWAMISAFCTGYLACYIFTQEAQP